MFKRSLFALAIVCSLLSVALATMQESHGPKLEITGLNPMDLPTVTVSVNVFDAVGQPVPDLTAADFSVTGDLADHAQVVSVRSFSDQAVPVNIVLAVDVSSSMAGTPIEKARAAASVFVDSIGPNDALAVLTFSSGTHLVQDYTTDKSALKAAIDSLGFGGETFLFDGALAAVQKATASNNPRRAVILLSDGAQYDTTGSSKASEQDVLNVAVVNGVPVYTIGLGFGADRHYLRGLSDSTNALFRESPTPEQLEAIFTELADLLRTQYEVTLQVDVPLDGTTYDLSLEANTPDGAAQATGRLRAPVPVPIVTLSDLPGVIDTLTQADATVLADDPLTSVDIALDGETQLSLTESPYLFIIDPVALAPGAHQLTYTATDSNGDTGTASADFTVAALPSTISIDPPLEGQIADTTIFNVDVSGQTAATSVSVSQDGGDLVELTEQPYTFTIDPFGLAPGDHSAVVSVTNAGNVTSSVEGNFSVPNLPIQFAVVGLEPGTEISETTELHAEVHSTQAPLTDVIFAIGDVELPPVGLNAVRIDPINFAPGAQTLTVTAENQIGQSTSASINFQIAALPPVVSLGGIDLGETLDADRVVDIAVTSQTPVTIAATVDGNAITVADDSASLTLDILALGSGAHVLSVKATNRSGLSATAEIAFSVAEGPAQTATAMAAAGVTPTEAPSEEPSQEPTSAETATPTVDVLPTVLARANDLAATAGVRATGAAQAATASAQVVGETATPTEAPATVNVQATSAAEATGAAQAMATANAQATSNAQATADLIATVNAQATLDAEASATAAAPAETEPPTLSPEDQAATLDAASTAAVSGLQAMIAGTAQAREAASAQTATAEAELAAAQQATDDAASTATQLAVDAQATTNAEATANAQVTEATQEATEAAASATPTATVVRMALDATNVIPKPTSGGENPTATVARMALDATNVIATPTSGGENDTPVPTITPMGTLIPAQAETTPSTQSMTPLIAIVVVVVVILLLIYFFLSRGRRRR